MCKIVKECVLMVMLPLFLVSCGSVNSSSAVVEKDNHAPSARVEQSKPLALKPKCSVAKKIRVSKEEKPQEVARVCFDKSGKAHNCNYKIHLPYKSISTEPIENRLQ